MRKISNILAAVAAVAAFASPVSAAPILVEGAKDDQVRTTIIVRGLESAEIDRRIAAAARRVCGAPESHAVAAIARVSACRAAATADARERAGSVAAIY